MTEILQEQFFYEDYRDSLGVFADVLGMTSEILSISDKRTFGDVARVLGLLREQARLWRSMDGLLLDFQAVAGSDSVVISMPWNSGVGATALIEAIGGLQYGLLLHAKHLLRGYMARGRLYHKDEFIFGEAYIKASKGEQGLRNGPPRIVVDPELAEYALKHGAAKPPNGQYSAFSELRRDPCDGLWFIDYLKPVGTRSEGKPQELQAAREEIRRWIGSQKRHHQADHHVGSKYQWLEQYEAATRAEFESLLLSRE